MNRITTWILPAVIVLGLAACETQPATEEGTTAEPATDTAAIETTIDETNNRFEAAIESNDPDAVAALYTDDAIVLPPGMPRVEGKEGIRAMFADWLSNDPEAMVTLTSDEVVVAESGDIAYEVGTATGGGTGPDGQPYDFTGKYLVTWENVDGQWLIAADAWSDDAPPPGMEKEGAAGEPGMGETGAGAEEAAPAAEGETGS